MADIYNSYDGPAGLPVDCTVGTLPPVLFADCPNMYNAMESEIETVFVVPAILDVSGNYVGANLPSDWTLRADLKASASKPKLPTSFTNVVELTVIGDKPAPSKNEFKGAKNMTIPLKRGHVVNLDITDMPIVNYEFIRTLQSGMFVCIWYVMRDGYVCGGADGIVINSTDAWNELNRGEGSLLTGKIVFSWENKFDPPAAEIG